MFHQFKKAKFANGGSILSFSQFLLPTQWPQKMTLAIEVVKIDSKIIVLLPGSKLMKHPVVGGDVG